MPACVMVELAGEKARSTCGGPAGLGRENNDLSGFSMAFPSIVPLPPNACVKRLVGRRFTYKKPNGAGCGSQARLNESLFEADEFGEVRHVEQQRPVLVLDPAVGRLHSEFGESGHGFRSSDRT